MDYNTHRYRKKLLLICLYVFIPLLLCCCTGQAPKIFRNRVEEGVTLEGKDISNWTRNEVKREIDIQARKKNKEAVNSSINNENWDIIPEVHGYKVDVQKTLKAVMRAEKNQDVKIIGVEINPQITADTLKNIAPVIGDSVTPILDTGANRVNNIELSINAVNKKILQPNEEFSFNNTVGPRTEEKGYEQAPIIVGTHKEMATGGGVCQLSTTLFNAAEAAGLQIVERHTHSKPIGYVPEGDDATISYGTKDLKFINNRQFPIMLRAQTDGKTAHVWIIEKRG